MINFGNTEIAFSSHSTNDLKRAKLLFTAISYPILVTLGELLLRFAMRLRIPVSWAIKPTIFRHFVGGETLEECSGAVSKLSKFGVKSILDFSVESKDNETDRQLAFEEILKSIKNGAKNPSVSFSVFKPSGIANTQILEKVSSGYPIDEAEQKDFNVYVQRVDELCRTASEEGIPILIDAEDSWYQKAIDEVADQMMQKYNNDKVVVYNTLQMYRTDRVKFLINSHKKAIENGYHIGIKLVRGAYMEKERARANEREYVSPIHETKENTDKDFNEAVKYCIQNIDTISMFCGTHNEESISYATMLMESNGIPLNDSRVFFSQLYGMSDNISFNLASMGYNVAKYIPYGPVKVVLPYLIRRAQENTSVKGQTGRELGLIKKELKRRRLLKKETK